MNTEDFKPQDFTISEIFEKQKEIKFLYEPSSRELFENFDINVYDDQEAFKRYCWRITEELMEALEDRNNVNHFQEELIDGFNFLIELYMLYGWDVNNLEFKISVKCLHSKNAVEIQILNIIYQLGITANLLKNRQWRQSQYLVDLHVFEPRFKKIWQEYSHLFCILGLTDKRIRDLWSLKYQVNLFRIKSNY